MVGHTGIYEAIEKAVKASLEPVGSHADRRLFVPAPLPRGQKLPRGVVNTGVTHHIAVRIIHYDEIELLGINGLNPVSYTHLDVYKRQGTLYAAHGKEMHRFVVHAHQPCETCRLFRRYIVGMQLRTQRGLSLIHI